MMKGIKTSPHCFKCVIKKTIIFVLHVISNFSEDLSIRFKRNAFRTFPFKQVNALIHNEHSSVY